MSNGSRCRTPARERCRSESGRSTAGGASATGSVQSSRHVYDFICSTPTKGSLDNSRKFRRGLVGFVNSPGSTGTHPCGNSSLICCSSKKAAFLPRCHRSNQSKSGGQDRLARTQSTSLRRPRAMNWQLFGNTTGNAWDRPATLIVAEDIRHVRTDSPGLKRINIVRHHSAILAKELGAQGVLPNVLLTGRSLG